MTTSLVFLSGARLPRWVWGDIRNALNVPMLGNSAALVSAIAEFIG